MSSSDVEIMPCRNEFLPQLTELWKEYMVDQGEDPLLPYLDLEASKEGFRKILESYLEMEPEGFLVALLGSVVVGFAVSFKNALGPNYITNKRIGLLQVVYVKRGYRRRGIATQLVNAAFSYLVANGCSIVLAETGEKNTRSIQILEKLGFKQRGKLVTFMKDI
jgi:ribosomal protein S18 acetylase RimI-like enzyme